MNKIYLITGAGHFPGTGSCLAEHLLDTNNRVVLNSRTIDNKWNELKIQFPESLIIVPGDITLPKTQELMVKSALDSWGSIDVLINNASTVGTNMSMLRQDWQQEFLLNVIVPHELSMLALPYLKISNGSIVMIGSKAGSHVVTGPGNTANLAYSVSKSALHHLTKSLSKILSPIRVNAIALSTFESARLKDKLGDRFESMKQNFISTSLTGHTVKEQDLIDAILLLANNTSISGQILPVCCGTSVV